MYTIAVQHTNPSRDGEYTKVERCDGYILLTFGEGLVSILADGMRPDADTVRKILIGDNDEQTVQSPFPHHV